jgi:hypothetical protein
LDELVQIVKGVIETMADIATDPRILEVLTPVHKALTKECSTCLSIYDNPGMGDVIAMVAESVESLQQTYRDAKTFDQKLEACAHIFARIMDAAMEDEVGRMDAAMTAAFVVRSYGT